MSIQSDGAAKLRSSLKAELKIVRTRIIQDIMERLTIALADFA